MGAPRCTGHKNDGTPCKGWRVPGSDKCRRHLPNPKARARAAVRAEVISWGLDAPTVDPSDTLLKLISQSAARAQRYATELEQMVEGADNLRDALVRQEFGEFGPVGEYVRGLVVLEASERERCAKWCAQAITAGLNERMVRVAEQQISIAERALMAALADIGLSAEQRREASARLTHHLRLVG